MQDFRYLQCISIMDCFGQLVSILYMDVATEFIKSLETLSTVGGMFMRTTTAAKNMGTNMNIIQINGSEWT